MKASYKLKLEQHQRRLGLTHKQLNRYDRKHNDINLIKFLQSLEVTAPAAPSGWYGEFTILNSPSSQYSINPTIEADTNGTIVLLNGDDTITPDSTMTIILAQQNRLTSPSTLIKVTYTIDDGGIFTNNYLTGITLTNSSSSIYNFTVNSGFIDGQHIEWEFVIAAPP